MTDQITTNPFLVETWVGGWPSYTIHATIEEAKRASGRPSEWGRIWEGASGFTIDRETGLVQGPVDREPIEEWVCEDEEE